MLNQWLIVIGILVCLLILLPFVFCLIDKMCGTKLSCTLFSCHNGNGEGRKYHDGRRYHAICSKCNKEVMKDSHGNWFWVCTNSV
jgi:hypothetical protein